VTAPQLDAIIQAATTTLTNWNSFVDALSSLEGPKHELFDLDEPVQNLTPPASINQIGSKLTGTIALVHNLAGIESLNLIPDSIVNEVSARVGAVRAGVEKLLTQINGLDRDSEITSLNSASMTAANQKNQQLNLPPIFSELYSAIQTLLVSLYQIRTMSKLNEEGGYSLQISHISAARSAQQKAYGALNRLKRALEGSQRKLDSIVSEAQVAAHDVAAVRSQTAEAAKKAEESNIKAEALSAVTNTISEAAGRLKDSVDAYQGTFNKFQTDLNERNGTFERGKADLDKLLADGKVERDALLGESRERLDRLLADGKVERDALLADNKARLDKSLADGKAEQGKLLADGKTEQDRLLAEKKMAHEQLLSEKLATYEKLQSDLATAQAETDRLLGRSREVLGEATVSGLSESFAREMKATGKQLRRIQFLFYFSIVCLLAAAGIVLNAFPWIDGWVHVVKFEPPPGAEPITLAVLYLGNFVSKLTFLLAPFILLIFAGRRYTELFRLKTQYTYKYTIAASLPGFKIEAPSYAEAITASAFKELLFNPGENVDAPEDRFDKRGGNTFIQRLIEPVVKRAMDKMGDVPKSA
jgi:hypothetical protein